MERFKSIKIILLLAVVLIAPAALAKSASELLQEGLYAEEIDGDLDTAIRVYAKIIKDGSGQRSHIAQAMYRQGMCYLKKQQEQQAKLVFEELVADYSDQTRIISKVKPLLQGLSNADPAALMPPDTLFYIEFGNPGKQVDTILNMLKGTPLENPLAAIGAPQGGASPGDIMSNILNPNMMAEFKKIRGIGIGATGVTQNDTPPAIIVLFPGKSDALRGLVMGALVFLGKPVEAIEGMQCVEFPDGGGAAYDDNVVILASPPAHSAGQLTWSVKQYKGVTNNPTLASSNKSFAKISKKDRQEKALTIWVNIDQAYTDAKKLFPQEQIPQEILHANGLADFENIDDVIAFLSLEENEIALEANVGFKDGHNGLAYNMFRTPKLSKAAFDVVPADAVALLSVAPGEADSAQAQVVREQLRNMTGLEIGGDIFANIEQVILFALPSAVSSGETPAGIPPIASSVGLVLTSENPRQTRQIMTGLLTATNLIANQSGDDSEANVGRYQFELVNKLKLHCYTNQESKTTVLSLNPGIIEASASALGTRKSVNSGGPLKDAVSELSPGVSKLAMINVGGAIRAGGAFFLTGLLDDSDSNVSELLDQLADGCEKTTVQLRTYEGQNNLNVRAEISDLPPLNQLFGPIMQLSQVVTEARIKALVELKQSQVSVGFRKVSRPVVIDGRADDLWSESRRYKIGNEIYSPPSNDEDFSASYKAMWDEKNLYILVDVTDDILKNDSDEFWLDDCVEVFVDADNSKSSSYGSNDYQYFFEWADANPGLGESRQGRTSGVEFATVQTDSGYRMEIKLPWSTLGVEPSAGTKVGLDVHVNDDDDGGDRDTKITWRGKEDNAWQTTEVLGTAELAGLVGWWKFDGNAKDSSGNANDGAENGNPTYVAGKFGRAVSFDGDGDRIEVPATVADNPELYPAQAASASAWVKTTMPADDTYHSVIRHEYHFTPLQAHPEGGWVATFADENGTRAVLMKLFDWSKLNDGRWHHYVATYNDGVCEVWIDGTREESYNRGVFSLWTGDNQPWVFGGKEGGKEGGEYYTGQLDDVRLYNYPLGEDEIGALYNEGK
ncbi:MAG TPA: hypothetical protein DIU00_09250 [Phycisphaerales bacterium]|nr:hypothetical protein [Phycisphaerales bacterium]